MSGVGPSLTGLGAAVRARRQAKGLSLRAAADRAQVSPSFLSQFETGRTQARVETLHRIARTLDTTVHELMGALEPQTPVRVIRAGRGAFVQHSEQPADGVVRSLLGGSGGLEALEISGAPRQFGSGYKHDGTELMYVIEGEVEVQVGKSRYRLGPGDAVVYPGSVEHRTRRLVEPVRLLVVKSVS